MRVLTNTFASPEESAKGWWKPSTGWSLKFWVGGREALPLAGVAASIGGVGVQEVSFSVPPPPTHTLGCLPAKLRRKAMKKLPTGKVILKSQKEEGGDLLQGQKRLHF